MVNSGPYRWTSKMVEQLTELISYLKRTPLGGVTEILGNSFIDRYKQKLSFEKYIIDLENVQDAEKITDAEYKLAYICELVHRYGGKKVDVKERETKERETKEGDLNKERDEIKEKKVKKHRKHHKKINRRARDTYNVYFCYCYMLASTVKRMFNFKNYQVDFKLSFLNLVLRDCFFNNSAYIKDDVLLGALNISSHLTYEIIPLAQNYPDKFLAMSALIGNAENLDIGLITPQQGRAIRDILGSKRIVFMRVLLSLAFEISREKDILDKSWIYNRLKIFNSSDFLNAMNNSLIEVLIFLTSYRLHAIGYS